MGRCPWNSNCIRRHIISDISTQMWYQSISRCIGLAAEPVCVLTSQILYTTADMWSGPIVSTIPTHGAIISLDIPYRSPKYSGRLVDHNTQIFTKCGNCGERKQYNAPPHWRQACVKVSIVRQLADVGSAKTLLLLARACTKDGHICMHAV